jgi:hypothetical protein
VVSLVCAHSVTDPDYAAVLAEAFRISGAALVGGREQAETESGAGPMAEAIVRATSSPFGIGSARYHYSEEPGWIDTAFPGAYRRELFSEIGGFDESLVRNQDDEFHLRARIAGHRMWYEPRLRSRYQPRRTLRALWSQYHQYGWWRAVTVRKHGRVASVRHLVPALLVAGLASGPTIGATRSRPLVAVWTASVAGWVAFVALAGWRERGRGPAVAGRVPAAVACLHLAYGVGFWRGVLHLLSARATGGRSRSTR